VPGIFALMVPVPHAVESFQIRYVHPVYFTVGESLGMVRQVTLGQASSRSSRIQAPDTHASQEPKCWSLSCR
jgi:hypothetical protein